MNGPLIYAFWMHFFQCCLCMRAFTHVHNCRMRDLLMGLCEFVEPMWKGGLIPSCWCDDRKIEAVLCVSDTRERVWTSANHHWYTRTNTRDAFLILAFMCEIKERRQLKDQDKFLECFPRVWCANDNGSSKPCVWSGGDTHTHTMTGLPTHILYSYRHAAHIDSVIGSLWSSSGQSVEPWDLEAGCPSVSRLQCGLFQ